MSEIEHLLSGNATWQKQCISEQSDYFEQLSQGQQPEYLYIGCSDSRVPIEQITGQKPGAIFVHRNIANQIKSDDINTRSVLYYALSVLKIKKVLVCGHTYCGGVDAVIQQQIPEAIAPWLANLNQAYLDQKNNFDAITNPIEKHFAVNKMNVKLQIDQLQQIDFIQNLPNQAELSFHGLTFDIFSGKLFGIF